MDAKGEFMMWTEHRRAGFYVGARAFCVLWILLVSAPGPLLAQLSTATLLGVVTDASGAVLPGATVTARNLDTGLREDHRSSGMDRYRLPRCQWVAIRFARAQGFKAELRTGLALTVTQEAVVGFRLEVGEVEETVTVVGGAPLVNTTNPSLGGLVDAARIESLPLLGRNLIDLTLMQTGVVEHNFSRGTARVGQWFSARGASLRSNNFLLDGTMTNTLHGAGNASTRRTRSGSTVFRSTACSPARTVQSTGCEWAPRPSSSARAAPTPFTDPHSSISAIRT